MKTHVYKLAAGLVLTLLLGFNLHAQEYEYIPLVKPGVQIWTEDHGYYGEDYYEFRRHALTDEDTVLNGEVYKKLYKFTDREFDPNTAECIGGLRENDQKQVFYYNNSLNQSFLLYDFSLSVGDTFDNCYSSVSSPFIVKNIDTVSYNGKKTRRFELTALSLFPYISGVWIEGMGNYEGLVSPLRSTTAHNWSFVRCYLHDNELMYSDYTHGGEDCTTPLASLDEMAIENNSIMLYPNPAGDKVKISSEGVIHTVEVFNALGQKVYRTEMKAKEKTLDVHSLSKGVYIIGVNTEDGYVNKKLVKE